MLTMFSGNGSAFGMAAAYFSLFTVTFFLSTTLTSAVMG